MAKHAISVTLDADNLTWLKGRAGAGDGRSVSELLDRIVRAARTSGQTGASRSVVGTIEVDASDPSLEGADAAIRSMFQASLGRPVMAKETTPAHGTGRKKRARRG